MVEDGFGWRGATRAARGTAAANGGRPGAGGGGGPGRAPPPGGPPRGGGGGAGPTRPPLPGAATYTDPLTEAPEAVATRLYLAALHRMITG
ncbi:hypothetical protein [Nocardia wallacei]|uniref:hypothetical protein n=1 Tax=Nocardia wallacei TaxID=480035 RepID=UPI002454CC15|nr:hypothetical protein [Nocardia wallacei]